MGSLRHVGIAIALCAGSAVAARAQHEGMPGMQMSSPLTMPLGISMDRLASGTTWIPDDVTLPSRHFMLGGWDMMLHGFAFAQYDKQGGPRGDAQFGSLNWAMLMADRNVVGGVLEFRFMPSIEAATVGSCGYPLLLQTGESCKGSALVDRQHPHDFFTELSAGYSRPLSKSTALLLYVAPVGEPALGPVAFMHRPSAMDNPVAPLGHHWQDATHVSFGVATVGVFTKSMRLEASAFNGLDADEDRWDIDPIRLNSYSARVTLNPSRSWSVTAGFGSMLEPEPSDPKHRMQRAVASAMFGRKLGDGQWATTFVVGANRDGDWSGSALLESEITRGRGLAFARAELVRKTAAILGVSGPSPDQRLNVGAFTAGTARELWQTQSASFALGASATVNVVPSSLQSTYGSRTPAGLMLFLRLRPVKG